MAKTYFNETSTLGKNYFLNHFRVRKKEENFFITTDCGSWVLLDKKEYASLIRHELDDTLFKLLEEKCIIITENNTDRLLWYQKNRLDFLFSGARLHIIIPTLRCNHKCVYCHSSAAKASGEEKDMDKETAEKTLQFIFQTPANTITIEFQGGESLINFELFKYIVLTAKDLNKTHKKEVHFVLITNMTLLNESALDWIVKEKIGISVSLDGPKKVHDKNRPYENGSGTYDDVTKRLQMLKDKGLPIAALMVTTKHSLPYWKEIIDEYVKWGITSIQIKQLNRLGFAEKAWTEIGYTTDEFIDFWRKSADYIIELNKKGVKIKERYINIILNKMLTIRDPSFLDLRSPCGIVIGQLAYNYNGDIYSCDEGRNFEIFNLGNVKTDSYKDVINKKESQLLVSSSLTESLACDNCAYKPFCGTCPVINYAERGNLLPILAENPKCRTMKAKFDYVVEKLTGEEKELLARSWLNWPEKDTTHD